jgi:hypothetical protein
MFWRSRAIGLTAPLARSFRIEKNVRLFFKANELNILLFFQVQCS